MVGEAVEKRGSHFRVAEDAWPFSERGVGCDDDRDALRELADEVEEALSTGPSNGQISAFVEDQEVEAGYQIGAAPPGARRALRRRACSADRQR